MNNDRGRSVKFLKGLSMKKLLAALVLLLFIVIIETDADALCVKVSKANLRAGPSTKYEKVWEVYKYMPFKKVGVSLSGDWYAVQDLDGDVSWIHKRLVTEKYRCAVVKSEEVNIRTGPGTKYKKTSSGPAKQYYSFRVLERRSPWVKVKDEWGEIGWIHTDYLWIK
jgi:SH3-like domain-containing protein